MKRPLKLYLCHFHSNEPLNLSLYVRYTDLHNLSVQRAQPPSIVNLTTLTLELGVTAFSRQYPSPFHLPRSPAAYIFGIHSQINRIEVYIFWNYPLTPKSTLNITTKVHYPLNKTSIRKGNFNEEVIRCKVE